MLLGPGHVPPPAQADGSADFGSTEHVAAMPRLATLIACVK